MQRIVSFTLVAFLMGTCSCARADAEPSDPVTSGLADWVTISGDLRLYDFRRWHDQNQPYPMQPNLSYDSQGTAFGGDLKLKTHELWGFSVGFGLFTQHSIVDYASPNRALFTDPDVTQIAQTFLRYQTTNARVTVGRQLINTPFANSDMYTMLTRAFQGASGALDLLGGSSSVHDYDELTRDVRASFAYKPPEGPATLQLYLARMTRYQDRYSSDFTAVNRYSTALNALDPSVPADTPGLFATGIEYQGGLSRGDVIARAWYYTFFDYAHLQFMEAGYQAPNIRDLRPYLRAAYAHEIDAGAAYAGAVRADYIAAKAGINFAHGGVALIGANAPRHPGTFRNGGLVHPYNDLSDVLYDDTMISGLEDLGPGQAIGLSVEYKPNGNLSIEARYVHYVAYYGTNGAVYGYDGPVFFAAKGLLDGQLIRDQKSHACEVNATWKLASLNPRLKGLSVNDDLGLRGGYDGASNFIDNRLGLVYAF